MSKGICLCSGGLDSTLALIKLLKSQGDYEEVVPMFVDYGQYPAKEESKAFYRVIQHLYSKGYDLKPEVVELNFGDDEEIGSAWGRGIALVGIAAVWAYTHGNDFDYIALGNHQGDVGPDCKPGEFDWKMRGVLLEATKNKLNLALPIESLTIGDIGKELASYGVPFSIMYSCYWGTPCGFRSVNDIYLCPGCRRKALAMKAAGIVGGTMLKLPNCKERSYQSELAERTDY